MAPDTARSRQRRRRHLDLSLAPRPVRSRKRLYLRLVADDASICPVEVRNGEVWVKMTFGHADSAGHWRERLGSGLAHDINLVIAKAVLGQLVGDVPQADIVQQVALFGAKNRDGWGVGLTILTALANLLPVLPEEEAYLALFHGARWVAADCDGEAPRRERTPLDSQLEPTVLKRWLRRWTSVRHREAAERTLLTAIAAGKTPSMLADALLAAATERRSPTTGTRSTSSTRRSSALTWSAGSTRRLCCRLSSARW